MKFIEVAKEEYLNVNCILTARKFTADKKEKAYDHFQGDHLKKVGEETRIELILINGKRITLKEYLAEKALSVIIAHTTDS